MILLVDLDGVVYRASAPVPGVAAVLSDRAARGDSIVYVTNNSMHYRADYVARLAEMGAPVTADRVVSSPRATALYLVEQHPEVQRVLAPTHRALTVTVTVKEYRSKTVSVLGEVQNNAQLPLRGRTTLVDILVTAGGPRAQADLREVRLLRRDGQAYTVDLLGLVSGSGQVAELVLDAGDVVFVPGKRTEEHKVFLLGEVNAPGAYPIVPNMRLSQALALAGGPKDTALLDSARVIRGNLDNPQVVQVDFERALSGEDRAQDLVLERNDLIVVPRSAIANWNAFLGKLKPTLEFLSLPLAPFSQYLLIRELLRD